METIAAADAGFLIAVLWFDLMFDVQVRRHPGAVLPAHVLASSSAYYRRVTTEAMPMGRLVSLVMTITVVAVAGEIVSGVRHPWLAWASLGLSVFAMALAGLRIVPNAVRLGQASDGPEEQSALARSIFREHLYCFAAMCGVLALQLGLRFWGN